MKYKNFSWMMVPNMTAYYESTDYPEDEEFYANYYADWLDYLYIALSIIVIVIGIPGNIIVIIVVKVNRSMWTTTNLLLVNLACADLLSLFFGPFLYSFDIVHPKTQLAADYLCKFITGSATIIVTLTVSVITLTVVAVERYRALVLPLRKNLKLTEKNIIYAIVLTWVGGIGAAMPAFIEFQFDKYDKACHVQSGTYYIVRIVTLTFVPALIIGFSYFGILRGLYWTNTICTERNGGPERQADIATKKKLCKLLITVTAVFYVCYLPRAIVETYWSCVIPLPEGDAREDTLAIASDVGFMLVFVNSSLNPIIYAFNSSNYRRGFKKLCKCGRVRQVNGDSTHRNTSRHIEMVAEDIEQKT